MTKYREVYNNTDTNVAAITATQELPIQDQVNAEKAGYVPHNAFTMGNLSTACTLFIFLDDYSDEDKPDYVLFPRGNIAVGVEDGVKFTTLWVKNTHAATDVAINELKYKVSTIREVD